MKPSVAVFTKTSPVTKRHLWECFRRSDKGFADVQVDDAHSIIGKNAPRVMERNGYLVKRTLPQGDYYRLTAEGEAWLVKGILSYVKNHPVDAADIAYLPAAGRGSEGAAQGTLSRRVRRTR